MIRKRMIRKRMICLVRLRVISWDVSIFILFEFVLCRGRFNTIIPLALVGYEMVIVNGARAKNLYRYDTKLKNIVV